MKSDLIFSDDQSHFTNAGEEIMALGEVAWSDVFYLIDDAENSYRNALFQIMSEPAKNAHTNPLNSARKKPSSERNLSEPLFKSCSQNGPSTKFHYVRRLTLTRAWFFENGFVTPFVDRPISQYKRFPKTFPVAETIIGLADDDLSSLLQHCIVDPETRESLSDGFWESSIEADFARVRTRLGELSAQGNSPEVSLNVLFNEALAPTWERKTYDPFRRATFHYLFSASAAGKILLPAQVIARHRSDFSFIYTSVLRGPLLQLLCKGRFDEVVHATQFEPNSGNSHRNISTADLVCMFCCSNYGLTAGFQPEAIYLVRQTLSNEKHNLRPYFFGAADFYEADIRDIRLWANRLKSRRSEELSDDPLALFRADTAQVRRTMPLQVEHFEEKTATRYPSAISTEIRDWAYDLESLLDRTPRKSRASMYRSVGHWLMYLYTLDDVPGSFADLRRHIHIANPEDPDVPTYQSFLDQIGVQRREPLRDLYQLFTLWAKGQTAPPKSPIDPKIDWKNPPKKFGTHRSAIPGLVIETLIEENARDGADGFPYGFYRATQAESMPTSALRLDGSTPNEVIPAVPACLDCILNIGLRSSTSRWMDSGQGDELTPDLENLSYFPNIHPSSTPKRRSGALQLMEPSPGAFIPSLLLLKDKSGRAFEIPFLPKELGMRLQFVAQRQFQYNPIVQPIRAVEDERTSNPHSDEPFVYPLFLHPGAGDRPISPSMLHKAWCDLLRHCEPIVNAKRSERYGDEIEPLSLFKLDGSPVWDIHSIRVSVVTALLDLGVPPTIVQKFIGHANPIMTLHYHSADPEQIQQSISSALEQRRLDAARAISLAETEEELDDAAASYLGGLANCVAGADGMDLARRQVGRNGHLGRIPDAFSVFSHGICPGGSCAEGGEKWGNRHVSVHRDKACSRCRFRITGPAFLSGLAMNANLILLEIGDSVRMEAKLNTEIRQASRDNAPIAVLESRLSKEREFRDQLWADWAAEYRTIEQCVALQGKNAKDCKLPAPLENISVQHSIREGDQLSLLQSILLTHRVIQGSVMDVPEGLKARRDDMLWKIAGEDGDTSSFLLSLPPKHREAALEAFASVVADLSSGERSRVGLDDLKATLRIGATVDDTGGI